MLNNKAPTILIKSQNQVRENEEHLLITEGSPYQQTRQLTQPLFLALKLGVYPSARITKLLLERGANVNIINAAFLTPLNQVKQYLSDAKENSITNVEKARKQAQEKLKTVDPSTFLASELKYLLTFFSYIAYT